MPETKGEIRIVKLCQVNFGSTCSSSHFIKMKNCGTFFVYELTPLDICSSAYCFGKKEIRILKFTDVLKLIRA